MLKAPALYVVETADQPGGFSPGCLFFESFLSSEQDHPACENGIDGLLAARKGKNPCAYPMSPLRSRRTARIESASMIPTVRTTVTIAPAMPT